jgi:hypothetical protein
MFKTFENLNFGHWDLSFVIWDLCDFILGKKELIEVLKRVHSRVIGEICQILC